MALPNHKTILAIALPIMASNVTEPLIGIVNTAVVGQLPKPELIGGVAIGTMIFAFLFWGFGFLRLSTSGLAAQATGAKDHAALAQILARSLLLALAIGLALLALSPVIGPIATGLIGGSEAVRAATATYFGWRIFSAPAALANFAVLGWFVGQGRAVPAFFVQVFLNLLNMASSTLLALHLGLGVAGVGLAAVIAEYAGLAFGLVLAALHLRALRARFDAGQIFHWAALRPLLVANGDIMLRTLLLLFGLTWFTARSARQGDVTVASNAILFNFFDIAAFLIDGFAYAAESLVGQAIGARDKLTYASAIQLGMMWGLGLGATLSVITLLFGNLVVAAVSVDPAVRDMARAFLPWAAATPFLGAACFLLDGIFTGALATREMRNMMVLAVAVYLPVAIILEQAFGNAGLWAALCFFLAARGGFFAWRLPAVKAQAFV